MNEETSLEQFKEDFIKGYIDESLNRLLDLRNAIKKATTRPEIKVLLNAERAFVKRYYTSEVNDEEKTGHTPTEYEDTTDKHTAAP